jgi:ferritin-like metal-binding protein YciE
LDQCEGRDEYSDIKIGRLTGESFSPGKKMVMDRKTLTAWLKDAQAMEMHWAPILRQQAHDARESLGRRARIEEHLLETERHVFRVGQALQALGSSAAPSQAAPAYTMAIAGILPARFFSGDRVKDAIAELVAEQLEIAAYTALIAAAEDAGEQEVARLCRLNRGEDEEMAEWREAYLSILISGRAGGAA